MQVLKFLHIIVPQGVKGEPKKEKVFLQFLKNLYNATKGRRIAFEILGREQYSYFYVAVEADQVSLITGLIYGTFPGAEIVTLPDYAGLAQGSTLAGTTLRSAKHDNYPFRTFEDFEDDSLAGLASFISKVPAGEEAWVQFVLTPWHDGWQYHLGRRWSRFLIRLRRVFRLKDYFRAKDKKEFRKSEEEAFERKLAGDPFRGEIRLGYAAAERQRAVGQLVALAKSFAQFNTTDFNEFTSRRVSFDQNFLKDYRTRSAAHPVYFSAEEVASFYHFPNPDCVPHVIHVLAKKAEPPQDLPQAKDGQEVCLFGTTNYHNSNLPFGILRPDRRRHMYAVGKSGTGKSKMLELLIRRDIEAGEGVGVLDPHGDLVDNVLAAIPKERMKDVIYFDAGDTDFPIAFNPLENIGEQYKMQVTIGFIDIFKKLFGTNWTHRLEHVLRYTVLALLDSPGTTVFSILKMLTDKRYRQDIVSRIQDSVVKNFWVNEFASWSEKFDAEAITPLLNKVGQFVATPMIRNIVAQPNSTFSIREVMDGKKILLMKVSKGILGEENSGLIGALIITKIYQAAMSRADILEEQRQDFYLYIDEFQNFATDTFYEILSEARKYRLSLTLAHQYLGQLTEKVRTTVFGNVGTIINFRTGAEDAKILAEEYAPVFAPRDILNLAVRDFYVKLPVNGEIREAFSARTLSVEKPAENHTKEIIRYSRAKYAHPVAEVEERLESWDEKEAADSSDIAEVSTKPKKTSKAKKVDRNATFDEPLI